jgi:hypothetical protein
VASLKSALPNGSNHAGLPAGLAAENIRWADLSPRGKALLQLIGVRTTLGLNLSEIADELRASPSDELSKTPRANVQGPTVSG